MATLAISATDCQWMTTHPICAERFKIGGGSIIHWWRESELLEAIYVERFILASYPDLYSNVIITRLIPGGYETVKKIASIHEGGVS